MEAQQIVLQTNQQLRKNRTILKTLCPHGKTTVRKEVLMSLGFQPAYFTSFFVTNARQVYYICYDFAFMPLRQDKIEKALIVTCQTYMKDFDPWKFVRTDRMENNANNL